MQSPDHYGDTQLMDYLISHKVPFAEGNIIKYVARWDKKDGIKDLYKARTYLDALIAACELSCKTGLHELPANMATREKSNGNTVYSAMKESYD